MTLLHTKCAAATSPCGAAVASELAALRAVGLGEEALQQALGNKDTKEQKMAPLQKCLTCSEQLAIPDVNQEKEKGIYLEELNLVKKGRLLIWNGKKDN